MATNENTLGAPTQGLGQTVTFAFDPNTGGVPQLQLPGSGQVQAGVQGEPVNIGGTMPTGVENAPNPTLDIIMKFAGKVAGAQMEKKKKEAFFVGMQRAMQGEAVADIAAEQPWYSQLFGDADVVEGARAYAANTVAQTTIAAMEDQMPELRKMGSKEAQQYFIDNVNRNLTGDRVADAGILQSLTRALPAVMRRQAKEHYGWQQENALTAQAASFRAEAASLQASATGLVTGTVTEEEFAQKRTNYLRALVPALGQDEKHYKIGMAQNLLSQAQAGNFHAINAARDSGFFDVLDEDQRLRVEKAVEAGESLARVRYSFDWNNDIASIQERASLPFEGTTTNQLATDIDTLNERYRKVTGSKAGLISPEARASYLSGSATAIRREQARQIEAAQAEAAKRAAAGDKAGAEAVKAATIDTAIVQGGLGALAASPGVSKEDINLRFMAHYKNLDADGQLKQLAIAARQNYTVDPVKDFKVGQIRQGLLAGAQVTPIFEEAYANYKKMREFDPSGDLADKYYGEYATRLEGMYSDERNGLVLEGSFQDRFINPPRRAKLADKDMQRAMAAVTSENDGWAIARWMGGGNTPLKPGQARRMVNQSSDLIKQYAEPTGDIAAAATRAWKQQLNNGWESLGGYVWDNGKGRDPGRASLSEYLTYNIPDKDSRIGTDQISEEFEAAVEQKLYGKGLTTGILPDRTSDIGVFRLNDVAGVPTFQIQAVVDGKAYNAILSANEVFQQAAAKRQRAGQIRDLKKTNIPGIIKKPGEL